MFTHQKVTEHKTVLGLYAIITRGKSQNQRWSVHVGDELYGPFPTKKRALQEASHQL